MYAVEIYSGTAGLTAALRRIGMTSSLGIDAHVTKQVRAPVIRLDLTTSSGVELLWRILRHPNVAMVHLGPPCGASSRARDIRRRAGPDPKPLRAATYPDGLPGLTGVHARRVQSANTLYSIAGEVFAWCCRSGILCTIENPARSYFWQTQALQQHLQGLPQLTSVQFDHCMYNGKWKKRTRLLCNHSIFLNLARDCDGLHQHLPWGRQHQTWATSLEVEYPSDLCKAIARLCHQLLLRHGVHDVPQELPSDSTTKLSDASRAVTGQQPRGKRLKPLVREYSCIVVIEGPSAAIQALPSKCDVAITLPPTCSMQPPLPQLPEHSKQLHPPMKTGDNLECDMLRVEYGIAWTPRAFVNEAAGRSHPGHFMDGVHPVLSEFFNSKKDGPSGDMQYTERNR